MARPPRDPSLLSWPWGSAPSGSGGPFSAVGLTSLSIVNSHAESAAVLADPMVGYWCRVGSLALTHTHNDVAILVQRRTLLSIFLLSRPPARCTKVVGCVSWSAGRVQSLGPKSSPGALHHWFVCSECMLVMSCIGLQSPAWVVGLFPDATCISPHDHFDGIRVVS